MHSHRAPWVRSRWRREALGWKPHWNNIMAITLCEHEVDQDYSSHDIHSKAFQHHVQVLFVFKRPLKWKKWQTTECTWFRIGRGTYYTDTITAWTLDLTVKLPFVCEQKSEYSRFKFVPFKEFSYKLNTFKNFGWLFFLS